MTLNGTLLAARHLAVVAAACGLAAALPAAAQTSDLVTQDALRVCADPANLPYSNEAGEGFENKVAELLAKDLGLPLQYAWYPQATGFVRLTLGAKRCDVIPGYAAGAEQVQSTNPYYRSAFALVVKAGGPLDGVETLGDPRLKERRLGVVAGTPPATIMVREGLITRAKPYQLTVDRRFASPGEDMVRDVASGEIDGGVVWGPIGGYFAKRSGVPLKVTPLLHEAGGLPMTFRIAFGVRHTDQDWKRRLNAFIAARQGDIDRILLAEGVPLLDEQDRPIAATP